MTLKLPLLGALCCAPFLAFAGPNFIPGETVTLTVTSAPASVAFALPKSLNSPDVMVTNAGNVTAYVGCDGTGQANLPGAGAVDATPIAPGASPVFGKGRNMLCAGVTQSGTTTLLFTAGQGE